MRRVILTLVAGVLLVWMLLPSREAPPAVPLEPAAAGPVQAPPATASASPDAAVQAADAARTNDVGQQLREELKGVVGGGGNSGLSKFNPFVN